MRLGIMMNLPHNTPEEWAEKMKKAGAECVCFPCKYDAPDKLIDAYAGVCKEFDLVIAEVDAWCNPMHPDATQRKQNIRFCQNQLALADHVNARCCVNIAGTSGEQWDGAYRENYSSKTFHQIMETTREIIDAVQPKRTFYTLEPMPWMIPDSPESCQMLLKAINRDTFALHMDIVNWINSPEKYFFNTEFMEKAFSILGKQIRSCHVKDILIGRNLTLHLEEVPCGKGALNLKRYAELASACDPDMPFLIEHLDTEQMYLDSLHYLRQLFEGDFPESRNDKKQFSEAP